MLLSTQTDVTFAKCGIDKGLEILANAGYDAIDYSMFGMLNDNHFLNKEDYESFAEELRKKAASLELSFNQAHAPFPGMRYGDESYNKRILPRVENAVRIAGILGAYCIVVHPIATPTSAEDQKEYNFKMYRRLAPIAKEYGVKIALENMWGRDPRRNYIVPNVCSLARDLAEYYDELNDPEAFTVCLDLGHCGLVGEEPDDAIRILGRDRLGALHVHDNNYVEDTHTVPYALGMKMNWDNITRALGEIDYKGDFTFEADNFLVRMPEELLPAGTKYMESLGRELIKKIDAHRPKKQT